MSCLRIHKGSFLIIAWFYTGGRALRTLFLILSFYWSIPSAKIELKAEQKPNQNEPAALSLGATPDQGWVLAFHSLNPKENLVSLLLVPGIMDWAIESLFKMENCLIVLFLNKVVHDCCKKLDNTKSQRKINITTNLSLLSQRKKPSSKAKGRGTCPGSYMPFLLRLKPQF